MRYSTQIAAALSCGLFTTAIAQNSYRIDVRVDGDPAFTDCLTFEQDHRLSLSNGALELIWVADHAIPGTDGFIATARPYDGSALSVAIHGSVYGREFIAGDIVNGYGQTYMFFGRSENCKAVPFALPGSVDYAGVPDDAFRPVRVAPQDMSYLAGTRPIDQPCFGPACSPEPPTDLRSDPAGRPDLSGAPPMDQPCLVPGCGSFPQPLANGDRAAAVTGGAFAVYLWPDNAHDRPIEECWLFEIDGTVRGPESKIIWRLDDYNTNALSFQSVAVSGGVAFHGYVNGRGDLTVSGIKADSTQATAYAGFALPVRGC